MNLLEIATYAAQIVGMTDDVTIEQARTFTRARWGMIWDAANWRQAQMEVAGSVPAGTEDVLLPADVELVLAVRARGNAELLPDTAQAQMSVDPAGFGQSGETWAFSAGPRDATTGQARIRLHRAPARDTALLLLCKRKCPALLADTDSPLIPGAGETLSAFVQADLLRWTRQYTKASEMMGEARELLTNMRAMETQQAAGIVRIVPMDGGGADGDDWLTSKG